MAAITDWRTQAADLPAQLLCGACSISGLYELEPVRLSYHNDVLGLDSEMAGRMSPLRHLPQGTEVRAVPLLCAVGSEETDEFHRQQRDFAAAWQAAGRSLQVVDMPGHTHFTIVDAMADPQSPLFAALRDGVCSASPAHA